MALRTTISLPEALMKRLEPFKDRVNVSKVCREALEYELDVLERTARATRVDNLNALLQRLEESKAEFADWSYDRGHQDGLEWAMNWASYRELREYGTLPLNEQYVNGLPFPGGDEHFDEIMQLAEKDADADDMVLVQDAYIQGVLRAVQEIWHSVADRV